MQAISRLAAPLRPMAEQLKVDLSADNLPAARASLDQRRSEAAATFPLDGVIATDIAVSGPEGRTVACRLYRPDVAIPVPVVVYFHSGAFVLGNLDTDHRQCVSLARDSGWAVLSVDYRLAPEHPFPAAVEDGMCVLRSVPVHAWEWGLDPMRLAVAGSSAGAGLAAVLTAHVREGDHSRIQRLLLHQPVLDDGCATPSMTEFTATPGFDRAAGLLMWQHYRGGATVNDERFAAARTTDLRGLPNTLITCSEIDPLRDEALEFAGRLLQAGVSTEVHVYPQTCHGFDSILYDWSLSRWHRTLTASTLRDDR